ncbi:hypothetical protein [Oryza sativa Japonica Group]|uniref:Uncharacterized protein n=2 Tax=Oryza sativa subsp. japonica TaxID=39947 RepID=Q5N8U9_ORYSJ|nr:hypothetical protein [Oryza sativa Japonica Group]BAD82766.1 hypothetical protein [Oryza sativa Japonica Group]
MDGLQNHWDRRESVVENLEFRSFHRHQETRSSRESKLSQRCSDLPSNEEDVVRRLKILSAKRASRVTIDATLLEEISHPAALPSFVFRGK